MDLLDWPARQAAQELLGAVEVLKAERETICTLCESPCPNPPDPQCTRVRWVMRSLARLQEAYASSGLRAAAPPLLP